MSWVRSSSMLSRTGCSKLSEFPTEKFGQFGKCLHSHSVVIKPLVVAYPQSHLNKVTICSMKLHADSFFSKRQSSSTTQWTPRSVFRTNFSLLQKAHVLAFNDKVKRCSHSVSRLSTNESLFVSYLKSLRAELATYQEEQNKNEQYFKTEKEKKIFVSRYQFLLHANEVISKIFEKHSEIDQLKSLSSDETDEGMKEMMENEIQEIERDIQQLEDEVIDVLAGDELADNNDIVLEINAGVGGQEAMLFCGDLCDMYSRYGQSKGWSVAVVSRDDVEIGGCRKAAIEISGSDVYKCLKYEAGVHRVQRIPKTEKAGRVHTSTVTVSVLPQPREIDVQIDKKDLKVETFRGSGPGGQSVNTTDSAVRVTYIPTGIAVECKQERSQIKNKEYAMKALKMRLYQASLEEEEGIRQATRKMHMGSRGRSEKIRTYNFQQSRVTDHRVKENLTNLGNFMAWGEGLDSLLTSLDKDYRHRTVESMLDEFEQSLKSKK